MAGVWKDGTHDVIFNAAQAASDKADQAASLAVSATALAQSTHDLLEQHLASGETPTWKILEATNNAEYDALSAGYKNAYNVWVSAGTLNMSVGTAARNLFLNVLFPPGTLTNTALTAMLS
jgi:hypothetical protein